MTPIIAPENKTDMATSVAKRRSNSMALAEVLIRAHTMVEFLKNHRSSSESGSGNRLSICGTIRWHKLHSGAALDARTLDRLDGQRCPTGPLVREGNGSGALSPQPQRRSRPQRASSEHALGCLPDPMQSR